MSAASRTGQAIIAAAGQQTASGVSFAVNGEQKQHQSQGGQQQPGSGPAALEPTVVGGTKIAAKFTGLSNRFNGFEEQIVLQKAKKQEDIEKKLVALQQQITALQSSLTLEARNRAQSVKALQSWLEERIDKWTVKIEAPMVARLETLNAKVDTVFVRLDDMQKQFQEGLAEFPKMIDSRAAELLTQIKEFKLIEEANQRTREEKEKILAARIVDAAQKLQVQFQAEKKITEQRVAALREDIDKEVGTRASGYEVLKKQLADEIAPLKAAIAKEVQERRAADEDLTQAIQHYTAALQDGIKLVAEHQ